MKKSRKNNNEWKIGIKVTWHFIERYIERVSKNIRPIISEIIDDMETNMNFREKGIIEIFKKNSSAVKIPFNKHQIVIKNGRFITIY